MPDEEGNTLPGESDSRSRWHSRDEEGYLEAGDLGGGAYGAIEGDLGFKLHPLAGFGRDLESPEEEIWPGVVFTPESHQTSPGVVTFTISRLGWDIL